MSTRQIIALILLASVAFVGVSSVFIVDQTEQALVLEFGSKPVRIVRDPGLNVKMPFVQNVEYYDKRLLDFDAESKVVTAADQKRLVVDAFVRYRIIDPLLFRQTALNEQGMRARLNSILESTLRMVIGRVPLGNVVSADRNATMERIRNLVNAQARGAKLNEDGSLSKSGGDNYGIEVVDVRIMRADLPSENSESIYQRMKTEREREAKEFRARGAEDAQKIRSQADKERTILLAEARKKAEITRGEGEGEATKIFAQSFGQDQEFFAFYRSLQAYRKTLNAQDTTVVLSPDGEFLKFLDKSSALPAR
ncbi:MAG: protease modulator HflC [Rickettsiales bacterium]|nr:protease modulator HflC [Rickettsiales bacterium]